jgi:hypothetical protein
MIRKLLSATSPRSTRRAEIICTALLTLLIEGVTLIFRFVFGVQAAQATSFVSSLSFGLRVHHCYVGAVVCALAFLFAQGSWLRVWALRLGLALVFSDLLHHFVVMMLIIGHHEFDLFYPVQ